MKPSFIPVFLSAAVLAAACAVGGMFFYRAQAVDYERKWSDAMDQIAFSLQNAPRSPSSPLQAEFSSGRPGLSDIHSEQDRLIADLLHEIARQNRRIEEMEEKEREQTAPRRPSAEERRQRLETLKETDPERYQELMTRQEERRSRLQTAFAERAATLLDRDLSSLNETEQEQYNRMLDVLQETWALAEQVASPDTPPEERRELRQTLTEKSRELRPMLKEERTRRFYELGLDSGYTSAEAQVFSEYINQTVEMTTLRIPEVTGRRAARR